MPRGADRASLEGEGVSHICLVGKKTSVYMTVFTEITTPPKSAKSRNLDYTVSRSRKN